jgi:hypothetical protein
MKPIARLLLAIALLCSSFIAHAENGCPSGMIPYSGTDTSSCGPIPPGYYQNNQGQRTPPIRWISKWGALATDTDTGFGSVGVAANFYSKGEAESEALSDCKARGGVNCKLQNWYSNGCVAMIMGKTGFNVGSKSTLNETIESGMKICKDAGDSNCHVYYSACSLPERAQ